MDQKNWEEVKEWLLELKVIDDEVSSPAQIRRLDLSGHALSELPESFGVLHELIALNLSGNQLQSLPESMVSLTKMTNLDLRRNHFSKLPKVLPSLHLRSLNLNGNMLDDVSELK